MPSATTSSEPIRVLLADDNEAMIVRAAAALAPGCVVVGAARDGRAALEAVLTLDHDVVVLDIGMPHMTGLEVASRLRQTGSRSAVVFLTVYDDEALIEAARLAGGLGYVVKPRLQVDLGAAVRDALAGLEVVSPRG